MIKDSFFIKAISKLSKTAGNTIRNNAEKYKQEETARIKEDDIIKAAAALCEAGAEDGRIIELLRKYWNISPDDAGLFLYHGKRKAEKNHFK